MYPGCPLTTTAPPYSNRKPDTPDQKKIPEAPISKKPNAHTTDTTEKKDTHDPNSNLKFPVTTTPLANTAVLWGDPVGQTQLEASI